MKIIHSVVLAVAISAAAVSSVQARDSFSLGINIGGYGYAPPVVYYPAPVYSQSVYYGEPVVYYREPVYYRQPVTYYQPVPRYYGYAPTVVSFGYQNYGGKHHGHHSGWNRGHHGGKHHGRGHRGHDD
jgi:hypothetical protein